jgi:metal-responsive CopG/Arc/MetJ family transcriptional regulator
MTFSIHIDDSTAEALARAAQATGRTRNALIRQAIREWLAGRERKEWPGVVRQFKGVATAAPFESNRRELLEPAGDPLARSSRSRRH